MFTLDSFKINDVDAEEVGKEFTFTDPRDNSTCVLKIASVGRKAFVKGLKELEIAAIARGEEYTTREERAKLFAETILLGWSGIYEADGKTEIKYSPELATKLMLDETCRDFSYFVVTNASDLAYFYLKKQKEEEKN